VLRFSSVLGSIHLLFFNSLFLYCRIYRAFKEDVNEPIFHIYVLFDEGRNRFGRRRRERRKKGIGS
jgi:hypothetical protein